MLLAWCLAFAAAMPGSIDAAEPVTPALILVRGAPQQVAAPIERWLRDRTDLAARSAEQAGIDVARVAACPADSLFTCLVRATLGADARWLLFVSVRGDELALFALDLEVARKELDDPRADLEDRLYGSVAVVRVVARDAAATIGGVLDRELAPRLSSRGHLDPYGEILLDTDVGPPRVIEIDGRSLGVSDATVIARVRAGSRAITVSNARERRTGTALVLPGARAELVLRGETVRPDATWGLVGGGASLALGAAALIAGAVDMSSRRAPLCVRRVDAGCDDPLPLGPPALEMESTRRSPWLGIGVGLGLLGATWLAASAFLEEDAALWGLGLGLGAGGVSAGLVLAL